MNAASKKTFPTINPQDETVIAQVAEGDNVRNQINHSHYKIQQKINGALQIYKLKGALDRF